jgi:hypothetical protein
MAGRLKCNSCGATWADPKVTGLIYSHQCPPQILQTAETADLVTHIISAPAVFIATPNPRNEVLTAASIETANPVMTAPGTGVTPI